MKATLEFDGIVTNGKPEEVKEWLGDKFVRIEGMSVVYNNSNGNEQYLNLSGKKDIIFNDNDNICMFASGFGLNIVDEEIIHTNYFTPLEERLLKILESK